MESIVATSGQVKMIVGVFEDFEDLESFHHSLYQVLT